MNDKNVNGKPQISLSETVVLVDAAFLNLVISETKIYFEEAMHRSLHEIDITELTVSMTLDAGLKEGNNAVQYLIVYDDDSAQIAHCQPFDLKKDLNGVAFQCPFGEYAFASVPSEGMVTREELFLDLLSIVADSADVKRIIVVSFNEEYGEKVTDFLSGVKDKELFQLRMNDPHRQVEYQWSMLAFPVMHALGVMSSELKQ